MMDRAYIHSHEAGDNHYGQMISGLMALGTLDVLD